MSRGPKAVALELSEAEQAELQRLLRRRGVGQALAQRVRVILACAEPGATNLGVAKRLGISRQTVATVAGSLRRASAGGAGGCATLRSAADHRRRGGRAPGRPDAWRRRPANATHWSTRTMARRAGMSQTAVSRIWRAFGLRPHQAETFKLSSDPAFVEKVRDVVGLYLAPPDRALVLCVDEKPQIQAVQGTAPAIPLRPGQAERVDTRLPPPWHARPVRRARREGRHGDRRLRARVIAASSSAPSWTRSRAALRRTWRCISCSTT